ncbi:hypothetical protein NM208_g5405 [Fusarium decemcellulare]|uniref:Uncharacterized protein n=1 Tax=Fusarium decemcellulare TaxID=57161 RepID=A0ACC1SH29_9HYPO|nr:hypothetical protein NM208_g5405 [Fusarium decemcellulare]
MSSSFISPLNTERLTITRHGVNHNIYKITMHKLPENRLSKSYAQELIAAFRWIEVQLGPDSEGTVITSSAAGLPKNGTGAAKFWCGGVELEEAEDDPYSSTDGLFPLIHTILDFPFPTIAEINGHTFGGGCPLALAHDYRIMNSERGYLCMPPVDLGLHFDGMGLLPRLKLSPKSARKMLLEGHRFTAKEALADGIIDIIARPEQLGDVALTLAEKWAPKAKMGVYGVLRLELYGPASEAFRKLSYVHHLTALYGMRGSNKAMLTSGRTEVAPGIIPEGTTYQQKSKYGLYPERMSGSSFMVPRKESKQAFLYRLLPSTLHGNYKKVVDHPLNFRGIDMRPCSTVWTPVPVAEDQDFINGLRMVSGAGDPILKNGIAIYVYTAGKSMPANQAFDSADGDFCIIPQMGTLDIRTEFGRLRVRVGELVVIPRGIRYHVSLPQGPVRGFVFETYSGHYELPELGPIGSYCLANSRDFEIPTADCIETEDPTHMLTKFGGIVHETQLRGSVFNVAAWHGTYYPFKYDLAKFSPIGSLLVDHPDPSIYTVLTCPSDKSATAAADICLAGPRWVVMENSFRPARFHRNTMTEFFCHLQGGFDNNPLPDHLIGLYGLNNTMTAHGPSSAAYKKAIAAQEVPERIADGNMFILFETCYLTGVTPWTDATQKILEAPADEFSLFESGHIY